MSTQAIIDQIKRRLSLLLCCSVWLLFSCSSDGPAPRPEASFTFSIGNNGEVQFINGSTHATSYTWDFGDGQPWSYDENPSYTYDDNEIYNVTLTASGEGGEATTTRSVSITGVSGTLTFWNPTPFYCGSSIDVTIGSVTSSITEIGGSTSPGCNESGFASFDLAAGDHSYTATCGSLTWTGDVHVSGGCNAYGFPSGSAMVYIDHDLGCGTIAVQVGGIDEQITQPNPSPVGCIDVNSAMYILPPGTYPLSGSCSGKSWHGNITITEDGCTALRLID